MLCNDCGPIDADIMLVGEAPGEQEEKTGKPFVGSSGKLLKIMLSHAGINFNNCYVTNVSPERPRRNKFTEFYEDNKRRTPTKELLNYQQQLRNKIEKINPKVVIALGAEPLRAITNKRGIEAWRGTILTYKDIKVIPTYHPSYVMRMYSNHPVVEMDFAKALVNSRDRKVPTPNCKILTEPSLHTVLSFLKFVKSKERISFDIETIGKHVRCIGIAVRDGDCTSSLVIPFIKFKHTDMAKPGKNNIISVGNMSTSTSSYWNEHDELLVLDAMSDIFEDNKIQKVGHNSIAFDSPLIEDEFKLKTVNHYMDTMHAFHLLYSELPKGLKFVNSILTNYPNYWTEKDTSDDKSEWTYCGYDAASTLDISFKIESELNNEGMRDKYRDINELAISLARMQERGIKVDEDARQSMIAKQQENLEDVKNKIGKVEYVDSSFNPNSPKQVKELLYDKLKFPIVYKNKKATTDEAAIKKLYRKYSDEKILEYIITYRKITKLIGTFLDIKLDSDGRMRTSWNASGTENGRISSSKTIFGTGMNLQNIPVGKAKGIENIRNIFVPSSEDKVIVKADLAQAETLVVAEILTRYGDYTLTNLYKNSSFDIHKWMASKTFNKEEDDVSKHERDIGKLANHSGNYMAGPGVMVKKALKEDIFDIDYSGAKRILEARHKAIPGLKKWWRNVEMTVRKTRTLKTCLNRKRIFFGRLDNTTFRDAVAFEPQSIVADVTNKILSTLELKSNCKMSLLLQVHDEIVGECCRDDVDEVVQQIKEASIIPLFINERPIIIPIDIEVGLNWRDTEEYTKV